jgi:hypothetical protein
VADGRRLSRLEIRVIGGERGGRGTRVTREGGSLVGEGIVQLAHPQPGRQPHADPERLAPRASGTEPARGRPADAPLQLGLARVEGITDRGIPRELVPGIAWSSSSPPRSAFASSPARSPPSTRATACARSASDSPCARRGPWALSAAETSSPAAAPRRRPPRPSSSVPLTRRRLLGVSQRAG